MRLALALAAFLLAGCASGGGEHANLAEVVGPDPGQASAIDHSVGVVMLVPVALPQWRALADEWANFADPLPPPAMGLEVQVAAFDVPVGTVSLTANFTRHHDSVEAFADHCRLFHGEDLVSQEAFSDAQYGNVASDGTCDLDVARPEAGPWTAVYSTDALDPMGMHQVHVVVMGLD